MVQLMLLVDTGSTYTILPWEALEKIGCPPSLAVGRDPNFYEGLMRLSKEQLFTQHQSQREC